jgi:diacylglycerol kinase (ATP)
METVQSTENPLVILNPHANRGRMDRFRTFIRVRLASEQAEYVETTRAIDAEKHAMDAASDGRPIVIVGGDGSVHEVVNGILKAGRRVPLGIVAAGSGNDYAWNTLGLPRDPAAAVERAFHGQLVDADVGIVNGVYFANSFSTGLDADIAVAANNMKRLPFMSGARLYYSSTLKQLLFGYHRCPELAVQLDDAVQERDGGIQRYILMAVTIGPSYGAGFRINPTANFRDGLFDVCAIKYVPLPRALRMLPVVQRGEHAALPEVTFYRARSVCIESPKLVNAEMDGETTGATNFKASILPGALQVRI